MATITTNSVQEFDSSFRQFTLYYTITLESGEIINGVTVTSNQLWCNVKNSTINNYSTQFELSSNNALTSREAIITLEVDTSISVYTENITIRQEEFKIYPIWANMPIMIETQANSIKYSVKHNNEVIYAGKAYVTQDNDFVEIDITQVCSSYINSSMEKAFNAPQEFNEQDGVKRFDLYINDEFYRGFYFYNSYSYKPNPEYIYNNDRTFIKLSDPIRKVYDSRQYIIYSFFNVLDYNNYYINFYFHKNQYTHSSLSATVKGRTEYTTLAKAPEGYDTVQFFQEYIPIMNTCCKYCLYYQNALGGWDSFLINGNDKQTDKITSYKYIKGVNNTTKDFGTKKYLNLISQTYKLYTDWLNDDEASRMFNLLESTEVYLHNLEDDSIMPVNITNNTCEYKTFSNNGKKKFYYTIDVELAQYRIRQ